MPITDPALSGFGDLASALLLAPQMARRNRLEEQDRADRRQSHDEALAQALRIQDANEQERAERKAERQMDRERQTRLDSQSMSNSQRTYDLENRRFEAQDADRKADNSRQMMGQVGTGMLNAGKLAGALFGSDKAAKTGSDAYAPDELKHRQMLADREADASGITTYENVGDALSPKEIRKVAPGKTWDDVLRVYQKYGILPDGVTPGAAPIAPPVAPQPTELNHALMSPNGTQRLIKSGAGYIPDTFTPAPTPAPGWFGGSNIPSADAFNASQGFVAQPTGPALHPKAVDTAIGSLQSLGNDPDKSKRLNALIQAAKAGDPGAIEVLNKKYANTAGAMQTRDIDEAVANGFGNT